MTARRRQSGQPSGEQMATTGPAHYHPLTDGPTALRMELAARQLSHSDLATMSGLGRSTVSAVLSGDRKLTTSTAEAILQALAEHGPFYIPLAREALVIHCTPPPDLQVEPERVIIDTVVIRVRDQPLSEEQRALLTGHPDLAATGVKGKRRKGYPHGVYGRKGTPSAQFMADWDRRNKVGGLPKDGVVASLQLHPDRHEHCRIFRALLRRRPPGQHFSFDVTDVAIDYPLPVEPLLFLHDKRKIRVIDSDSQTVQIGGSLSRRRISAYDRAWRINQAGRVLVRLEARERVSMELSAHVFAKLFGEQVFDYDQHFSEDCPPPLPRNPSNGMKVVHLWLVDLDPVERGLVLQARVLGWELFRESLEPDLRQVLDRARAKVEAAQPIVLPAPALETAWRPLAEKLRLDLMRGPSGEPWDQEEDDYDTLCGIRP